MATPKKGSSPKERTPIQDIKPDVRYEKFIWLQLVQKMCISLTEEFLQEPSLSKFILKYLVAAAHCGKSHWINLSTK